jgi:glycosyltransferase involved in cell wall biosynthesis
MMDCPPRVSVIIPTFNRSRFLRQAIASVLAQTFPDFEVLVVDDGSSDNTAAVVAAIDDPRIIYIHQENAGRSAARNWGLAQTRGEYIALLDDDDLYLPNKLAVQVAYMDNHVEIGLVGGGTQIIATEGSLLRIWESWKDQPQLSLPACLYACPLLTCSVLFRRQWLDAIDHWFDPSMDHAEDTDFWVRLLVADCRMAWTPDIVSAYRWHLGNSQQDAESYYRGYLMLLDKLYARDDLPAAVRAERSALYAHYHIIGACHAYATDQIELGQERLLRSAIAAPEALQGMPPPIVLTIAGVAQSDGMANPVALIDTLFKHLPQQMARLKPYRRYALSALHMQQVFAAHAASKRPRLKDWLLGIYQYPCWLTNRGVWSILLKVLGGQNGA